MVKIKVKEHVEGYKDQKAGFDKTIPVDGTYDVANIKMQWQKVGKKATEKLRLIVHVLKVVETADEEGSKKMVGGSFGVDVWWNLYKTPGDPDSGLNFNGQRLVNFAIACGCDGEFDPDNKDELVKILTGTPYRIKIKVKVEQGAERDYYNVDDFEVKHLSGDARKKYKEDDAFKKALPKMEDRRLEDADYSAPKDERDSSRGGKGGGRKIDKPDAGGGTQEADPFTANDPGFIDDDLPF